MRGWFPDFQGMVSQLIETIAPQSSSQIENPSKKRKCNILSIGFNQDCSCVCVGSNEGFRIYQCKPFSKAFECNDISARKVSMLFATSLVALVGGGGGNSKNNSPRNVKLYNTRNRQELCRLNFKSTVLSLKMNKSRLSICVETKIHVFDLINNMKQIHEINTFPNPNGIFDLCSDDDNCLLAYPDKTRKGCIGIVDAYNLQTRTIIEAHDSALQMIAFSADGNYIASASKMGTLIRIWALPKGTLVHTFRRGTLISKIHSISFNPSCTLLSCSSSNNTVHIFEMKNQTKSNDGTDIISDYLPKTVKNTIEHPRSCIAINIQNNGNEQTDLIKCGFLNDYSLLIVTQNGYFYRYNVDAQNATFKLLSEHSLKHNDNDLDKQQKTTIYNKKKKSDTINEEKSEINDINNNNDLLNDSNEPNEIIEAIKTIETNETEESNQVLSKKVDNVLEVDDLFDLSDNEYDANTETPQ